MKLKFKVIAPVPGATPPVPEALQHLQPPPPQFAAPPAPLGLNGAGTAKRPRTDGDGSMPAKRAGYPSAMAGGGFAAPTPVPRPAQSAGAAGGPSGGGGFKFKLKAPSGMMSGGAGSANAQQRVMAPPSYQIPQQGGGMYAQQQQRPAVPLPSQQQSYGGAGGYGGGGNAWNGGPAQQQARPPTKIHLKAQVRARVCAHFKCRAGLHRRCELLLDWSTYPFIHPSMHAHPCRPQLPRRQHPRGASRTPC